MNNLILRQLQLKDIPLLSQWLRQDYIQKIFGESEEWLEEIQDNIGRSNWVKYFLIQIEKPIGFCQYYNTQKAPQGIWSDEPQGTVGIDYFIGEKKWLGKGGGTRAVKLLLKKIRKDPAIKYVIADPESDNFVSIRLLRKLGFHEKENGLYQLFLFPTEKK